MSRLARSHPGDPEMWDAPPVHLTVHAFPPACRCSHPESSHGTDRRDRYGCFFAVCACTEFRPEETA